MTRRLESALNSAAPVTRSNDIMIRLRDYNVSSPSPTSPVEPSKNWIFNVAP